VAAACSRRPRWRRWHRKSNLKQKRYAVCSALAASAVPALVMARGHKIEEVAEVPLVLPESAEALSKTSKAIDTLKKVGAYADVSKAKASRNIRKGKGKMRNRRYVARRGPLVVYANDNGITKAFRNIPGVELCSVDRLNLLTLAPGGHVGRFIIWTKAAFEKLDTVFGTATKESAQKKGWKVPKSIMANSDLSRVINSDEIQSVVRAPKEAGRSAPLKKNPLKNLGAMIKLNPYAKTMRRMQLLAEGKQADTRAERLKAKRKAIKAAPVPAKSVAAGKKFYQQMCVDSEYTGELFDGFSSWLGNATAAAEDDE